jgi:phosphate-starvation-inducible protein E
VDRARLHARRGRRLLAASALALLVDSGWSFARAVTEGAMAERIIALLDRILLILMIVEILYSVQVSFREHALVPEPFLIVGLIAAVRRILVLDRGILEADGARGARVSQRDDRARRPHRARRIGRGATSARRVRRVSPRVTRASVTRIVDVDDSALRSLAAPRRGDARASTA